MIYRKTRLGIQIEPGSRNYFLQNSGDGENEAKVQSGILVRAWNAFDDDDGISALSLETIKKLDKILDKIDMVTTPDLSKVNFIVDTGETFTMNRGTSNKADFGKKPLNADMEKWVLEGAYNLCTKDGKLTKKEIEMIEKIDEVLPDAAIVINPQTGDATVASPNKISNLAFPKGSGKREK